MSNGSHRLYFRDPDSFRVVRTLEVQLNGRPRDQLNELEYIDGEIYANVWHEEYIVRISPETGEVVAILDLEGLRPQETRSGREKVLNGIAWDAAGRRLFVTGKNWPTLFEIRQVPA
jgi:glutamine cyclotransferase